MEDERNTASTQTQTQYQHQHQGQGDEAAEVKDRGILDTLLGRKQQQQQQPEAEHELAAGMDKVTVAEQGAADDKHDHYITKEPGPGDKKQSLLAKLHRSGSSSSSDEEEEVIDENGEIVKRKKKKGLKDKIKDKLPGGNHKQQEGEHKAPPPYVPSPAVETHAYNEDDVDHHRKQQQPAPPPPAVETTHVHHHDHATVVQKVEDDVAPAPPAEEEKKGLLDKIKEKLPGKKPDHQDAAAPDVVHAHNNNKVDDDVLASPDAKEKKGLLGKIMDKIPGYNKASADDAAADHHKATTTS